MKLINHEKPKSMGIAGQLASTEIVLSERNLLALLSKLYQGNSACTITSSHVVDSEGNLFPGTFAVRAEKDDEHYSDTMRLGAPAGVMHEETERVLKAVKEALNK